MRKLTITVSATILVFLISNNVFADEPGPEPYFAPRQPASAPPPPPKVEAPRPFTVYQAREVTPPAPAPVLRAPATIETDYDFFSFFAELLLWDTTEDGLAFAVSCPSAGVGTAVPTIGSNCNTIELDPEWQGGFKLGAEYTWSPDMWDATGKWTWYRDFANNDTIGQSIYPMWTHPRQDTNIANLTGYDVNAVANWHMEFNAIDIEIGKTFKSGTWVKLRPFGGVKGAILDQDFTANYQNSTTYAATLNNGIIMSNDFGGIGFRGGLDSNWDLNWYGLSVFAKASGSILWGRFKTHYLSRQDATGIANVSDSFTTTKAVIEGNLGVNLHTSFFLGVDYPFDFYCYYEDQMWFSQNQLARFVGDNATSSSFGRYITEKGDLGFNGVVFGLQVSF